MLENYWIVWPLGIVCWALLGWAEFSWLESRALRKDARAGQITLSFWLYSIFQKFPLAIALLFLQLGLFIGLLSTHFLWHWCPPGSISAG